MTMLRALVLSCFLCACAVQGKFMEVGGGGTTPATMTTTISTTTTTTRRSATAEIASSVVAAAAIKQLRGGGLAPFGVGRGSPKETKYIIVTGGVLSGIGKGVTASSIGVILKMMGLRATAIKIDPYLNVDAGTMSPFEHGEVFVLDDGGETDLDLGNYERFLGVSLRKESNLTTGKVYQEVIEKERRGDYLGKTVQVVPHITDQIQDWITEVAEKSVDKSGKKPDVCIIELGGTLGDIESMPFVEALRQLQERVGYKNCCFVHVSLVPTVGSSCEQKTKPTQHSVKQMKSMGLSPDFIMCRGTHRLEESSRNKLAMFCQVPPARILSVHDVSNIYRVPLLLMEQRLPALLNQRLRLESRHDGREADSAADVPLLGKQVAAWTDLADTFDAVTEEVRIGIVGKYTDLHDTYLSVVKALLHASLDQHLRLSIEWIDSASLEISDDDAAKHGEAWSRLESCHGILVPGGFGERGLEGKVLSARHARQNGIPYLGICLGMQAAVIDFARDVMGVEDANSEEFAPHLDASSQVIVFMPEGSTTHMGGTMRLGSRTTDLRPGSLVHRLYGSARIEERHRHRYEVSPDLSGLMEDAGLCFVGTNADSTGTRMEVCELNPDVHPFFVGTQYHPEYKSRPGEPSPIFTGFIRAARERANGREEKK